MSKGKVILDPHFRTMAQLFTAEDLERLRGFAEVVWARDEPMPQAEAGKHRDAVAIASGWWRHGRMADFPDLKAFMEVGGGPPSPKNVDYGHAFSHGVRILSCAPAFGPAVAELALAGALNAARRYAENDRAIRRGEEIWEVKGNEGVFSLYEKPVGFIGYGGLARCLKPLLAPFRCPIKVYDPWLTETMLRRDGVTPAGLDEVLESSRVTFVLAIPTPENRGLLSRGKLSLIPSGAVLVLISRAHLADFDALTELVSAGRFRAAIDVYPAEPLAKDHPIRKAEGAVLSAHKAGAIPEALQNIGRMVVDDLEAVLAGLPPSRMQVVQPEILARVSGES